MALLILHGLQIFLRNRGKAWIFVRHVEVLLQRQDRIGADHGVIDDITAAEDRRILEAARVQLQVKRRHGIALR
ncbi:hypothetical protein D3C74_262190 [compost metagenome]